MCQLTSYEATFVMTECLLIIASGQIPLEISLSIRLGLNEAQTEQIKRDNPTEREKVIAMFRKLMESYERK